MLAETPPMPVSKVLVLDTDAACQATIAAFCAAQRLQPHKVRADNILAVLRSNIDLGAIFLSNRIGDDAHAGISLGRHIHAVRPELPIFLRAETAADAQALPNDARRCFAAVYVRTSIDELVPLVQQTIFSLVYPPALVRGIAEITRSSLESQFRGLDLQMDPPFIVRDRLIYGEIFTLIPIESHWCRGFMTLQTEEAALQRLVRGGHTALAPADADDFRSLNGILGEITNLVWGGFRNRYDDHQPRSRTLSQVPIVVNHLHRYISFGSTDPQLCFRCVLHAPSDPQMEPVTIYQRFVFSLDWSPDDFRENTASADSLVEAGELELF